MLEGVKSIIDGGLISHEIDVSDKAQLKGLFEQYSFSGIII